MRFFGESDFDLAEGELRNEDDLTEYTTGKSGPELRLAVVVPGDVDDIEVLRKLQVLSFLSCFFFPTQKTHFVLSLYPQRKS